MTNTSTLSLELVWAASTLACLVQISFEALDGSSCHYHSHLSAVFLISLLKSWNLSL